MQCRSVLTRIDALRTGELSRPESAEVKDHLKICPSCDESTGDVQELARIARHLAVTPPRSCAPAVRSEVADRYDLVESGDDSVWVAFTDRGMRMLYRGGSAQEFEAAYRGRFGRALVRQTLPDRFRRHVEDALSGRGARKPPLDLVENTEFEEKVLDVLKTIPRGEVRTYGWVARQAGRPGAVRAVGSICARNVVPFVVPCHRVVPTTGGLGQYAFGPAVKRQMLEREGVSVDELEEMGRRGIRFIGSRTTRIFCFPTCHDAARIREENRVPFHEAREARSKGFRPCQRCRPAA